VRSGPTCTCCCWTQRANGAEERNGIDGHGGEVLLVPWFQTKRRTGPGEIDTTFGLFETIRLKHALFYASLAERASRSQLADSDLTFAELELEHDNLRSALRWLIDHHHIEPAERLAGLLGRFWFFNGHFSEGRTWFTEVLDLPYGRMAERGRATVMFRAGP